jgi:hypothetical protein
MIAMLTMKERQSAYWTVEGWARIVLLEVGAIRECEEDGWIKDCSDPHARGRALLIARHERLSVSLRSGRLLPFATPEAALNSNLMII